MNIRPEPLPDIPDDVLDEMSDDFRRKEILSFTGWLLTFVVAVVALIVSVRACRLAERSLQLQEQQSTKTEAPLTTPKNTP